MNFTYDTENRLVSASGAKTASLSYDPLGRLYQISAPTGTTRFLYDGDALVAEYDNVGILKHRYVHGNGVDQPLVWYDGSTVSAATRRHLFANWQGSISAVTDSAGNAMHVNAYDAYGIPNDTNVGRFQYTGQILLTELGMYHYKARIYSPYLGRFLQTDPIGYDDQFNLYAYVGNDPVGKVDPSGTSARIRENERQEQLKIQRKGQAWAASVLKKAQFQRGGIRRPSVGRGVRSGAGGLRVQEGGIHKGHTIARHVGRTNQQLRTRLKRDPSRKVVSTFRDLPNANAAFKAALQTNSKSINAWLNAGGVGRKAISFTSPVSIGRILHRNAKRPVDAYTATFYIQVNQNPFIRADIAVVTGFVN